MLESNARSQSLDCSNSNSSSRRNPFELLTSIFAKKKSLVDERDSDVIDDNSYAQTNDENLFSLEVEEDSLPSSTRTVNCPTPAVQRNDSTEKSPSCASSENTHSKKSTVKCDLEALHQSRQDNPYLQHLEKLSSQDDRPLSLNLPSSPFKNLLQNASGQENVDLHQHLIRSPPPQFPQNVSHFIYSRTNSPRHYKDSSNSLPEILEKSLKNGKKVKFLKPLQTRSEMDVLDPSIRKIIEFQRKELSLGSQRSTNQDDCRSTSLKFAPVSPSSLQEIPYHPQSRWVQSKGSRNTQKRYSYPSSDIGALLVDQVGCAETFSSDDTGSRKTPLGPINVSGTFAGNYSALT